MCRSVSWMPDALSSCVSWASCVARVWTAVLEVVFALLLSAPSSESRKAAGRGWGRPVRPSLQLRHTCPPGPPPGPRSSSWPP